MREQRSRITQGLHPGYEAAIRIDIPYKSTRPGCQSAVALGAVANWIHGSELSTAEIDRIR
jgi:hypothetical protein